jgi:hypothetical protein
LPHTLPSPKAAREALVAARKRVRAAVGDLAVLAEAHKGAREMMAGADAERAAAADDLEHAPDDAGASTRYLAAVENLRARRLTVDGSLSAVAEARKLLRAAERAREACDEDLLAIAHGRRGEN